MDVSPNCPPIYRATSKIVQEPRLPVVVVQESIRSDSPRSVKCHSGIDGAKWKVCDSKGRSLTLHKKKFIRR